MKYIDADRLRAEIKFAKSVYDDPKRFIYGIADAYRQDGRAAMCDDILKKIDSLQQDETQVDKILCFQVWWEEQGWIMIPPDATIEGIDSLLRQVRNKLQQECIYGRTPKEREKYCKFCSAVCNARVEQEQVDLEKTVEFECIGKKVKMTIQELINYYINSEYVDVADECDF